MNKELVVVILLFANKFVYDPIEAKNECPHFGQQTAFCLPMGLIGLGIKCSWLIGEETASGVGGGAFDTVGDIATFIGTGEDNVRWRLTEDICCMLPSFVKWRSSKSISKDDSDSLIKVLI